MHVLHHPFINSFRPAAAHTLILGSFPCLNRTTNTYGDWFYSGSGRNEFWPILGAIFRETQALNHRSAKAEFLERHGLAITDLFKAIVRKKDTCLDADLRVEEYNIEELEYLLQRYAIRRIFFTSKFVETHFNRIKARLPLDPGLQTHALVSPSPAINKYMGKQQPEYLVLKASGQIKTPLEYKILKYAEAFQV